MYLRAARCAAASVRREDPSGLSAACDAGLQGRYLPDHESRLSAVEHKVRTHTKALKWTKAQIHKLREVNEAHKENPYVTKDQFEPIKILVYGAVGLVLSTVVVAILAFVIRNSAK